MNGFVSAAPVGKQDFTRTIAVVRMSVPWLLSAWQLRYAMENAATR